jgi:hypothetical protein
MTQEQLAAKEGKAQSWVARRLLFGRFMAFQENMPDGIITKNLTEGRFRGYWERTDAVSGRVRPRRSVSLPASATWRVYTCAKKAGRGRTASGPIGPEPVERRARDDAAVATVDRDINASNDAPGEKRTEQINGAGGQGAPSDAPTLPSGQQAGRLVVAWRCGDRKSSRQIGDLKRFTKDTAAKTGESERKVQREATRAKHIPQIADCVDTSLDQGEELDALAKLPVDQQNAIIAKVVSGHKVSAKIEAKRTARAEREAALAKATEDASRELGSQLYSVIYADPPWRFK